MSFLRAVSVMLIRPWAVVRVNEDILIVELVICT